MLTPGESALIRLQLDVLKDLAHERAEAALLRSNDPTDSQYRSWKSRIKQVEVAMQLVERETVK